MLIPMIVRGTGAALTVAGQYPLPSSNPNAFREAPTHISPPGQEVNDPTCLAVAECVHHRRCLNVFYNGCYLGPYHVIESRYRAVPQEEARQDDARFRLLLSKLNNSNPNVYPKTLGKEMQLEMASTCAPGYWFTLEPLHTDFLEL